MRESSRPGCTADGRGGAPDGKKRRRRRAQRRRAQRPGIGRRTPRNVPSGGVPSKTGLGRTQIGAPTARLREPDQRPEREGTCDSHHGRASPTTGDVGTAAAKKPPLPQAASIGSTRRNPRRGRLNFGGGRRPKGDEIERSARAEISGVRSAKGRFRLPRQVFGFCRHGRCRTSRPRDRPHVALHRDAPGRALPHPLVRRAACRDYLKSRRADQP